MRETILLTLTLLWGPCRATPASSIHGGPKVKGQIGYTKFISVVFIKFSLFISVNVSSLIK